MRDFRLNGKAVTKVQAAVIAVIIIIAIIAGAAYYASLTGPTPTPATPTPATPTPATPTPATPTPATPTPATPTPATPTPAKPAPDYILIGAVVDVTGPNAFVESYFLYAWKWAVEKVNEKGGVYVKEYGKKIPLKFIYYDDQSDVSKAVSSMETLILRDNVLVMIGRMGPIASKATIPLAEKYCIPTIGLATYPDEDVLKSKYYWSQPFTAYEYQTSHVFMAINDLKLATNRKVAILLMEQATTPISFEYFKKNAEKYGFDIVYMESFTILTGDYTVMISKMKDSGADIMLFTGIGPDATTFWRQCKVLNYRPKLALIELGARTYGWIESMGKDGEYVLTPDFWCPKYPYKVERYGATSKELADDYERETGEKWDSSLGHSADTIFIIADAIEKAGCLDREKVNEAMAQIEGEYLCGHLKFVDHHMPIPASLFQWQGGEKKLVWVWPGIPMTVDASIVFPLPPWD
jgi:branched-chain amino acid transport system substrate-binding protein